MKRVFPFILMALYGLLPLQGWSSESPVENLPPILEAMPTQPFETLSKVGAGEKTIDAARLRTQREAIKVDADAIINLKCQNGRVRWEGLVFQKEKAYCEGYAIHFTGPKNIGNSPSKPPDKRP